MPAIEVQDLKKYYGATRAVDGVSFTVEQGEIFGMLGPNGAGKSTTVKVLTTLSRLDEGEARVAGFDVIRRPGRVRRAIGVVAQKPGVDMEATGRENVRLQGQLFGMRGRDLEARVSELLERFGLVDAADRIARTYSGGMQRRLDIAIGLINRPDVLFLDEPTTGLDPEVRTGMWEEIRKLATEDGITIFLTTHYLEEADHLAGRLAIVDRGRIVAEGTPEELKGELKGDSIQVELADGAANGRVTTALQTLGDIREVQVSGRELRARTDDGARAVPIVLQALEAHGVSVSSVTVSHPSLEDVYLRHTGRSFAQAESEAAGPSGTKRSEKEKKETVR